jgi:transcriptional regulator with XRE-family HTH domain
MMVLRGGNMLSIGNRIKALRENENWTAKELALKMEISQSSLSKLENNKKSIDANEVKKLTEIFNVTADYILGIENSDSVVLYMKRNKNLDEQEISEINSIFARMDEAIQLRDMKERLQKGKLYAR